ncbi:DUF2505 domain-containing protein [Mycolicibacterium sp. 018/SC-01/001]|uniref:DUF2505 domain-containing protein n=1 Tax=Mycolicibacterium sp. 018/SC-01/001 TaxID=2592069 RepID=UPI00117F01EA|nr:DUF2505 domain-containing protein [Mycolicibacterium sp. 018/SC-01/001]TRW82369.1 DUF2505 domain-containing protein [Mycolicibacterium sp. 018/SC-01/001]
MARPFDVSAEASAEVDAVFAAFARKDYWLARLAAYGGDSMTLDSLTVAPDGSVVVQTTQDLRQDMLPGQLGRMLPGDTSITRRESWRRGTDAGEVHGEFHITARGVPSSGSGTMVLQAIPAGSRLRVRGTVEVKIPLVGGRIESYVADLIAKDVPQMQQFTADWIAGEA